MRNLRDEDSQRIAAASLAAGRLEKAGSDVASGKDFIDRDLGDVLGPRAVQSDGSRGGAVPSHLFERCRFWFSWISPRSRIENASFLSCDFHGAAFEGSEVCSCSFAGSRFSHADLGRAAFSFCDFRDARLFDADLSGARFVRCDFRGADFSGANLQGVLFEGCQIGQRAFDGAKGESLAPSSDREAAQLFGSRKRPAKRELPLVKESQHEAGGTHGLAAGLHQLQTPSVASQR